MIRYTVLRLLVFIACLLAFWLLGLRGQANIPLLVVVAAVTSMGISYFLLRPVREQFSDELAEKVEGRIRAKREQAAREGRNPDSDEAVEDQEIDDSFR